MKAQQDAMVYKNVLHKDAIIYNNAQKYNNIQICTRICSNIHVKKSNLQ